MSFQKLTTQCLCKLRPALQSQLPLSTQILNIVDLKIRGMVLTETCHTELYHIPGTEVINVMWKPSNSLRRINPTASVLYIPDSLLDPSSSMTDETDETKTIIEAYKNFIDWDRPHHFHSISPRFVPHLEKIIVDKKGIIKRSVPVVLYYLPEDVLNKIDTNRWKKIVSDKFEAGHLHPKNSRKMNWYLQYSSEDGASFLAEIIKVYQCTKGIFRRRGFRRSLVSWCLITPLGTIASIYTIGNYRGLGLSQWALEECSKSVVESLQIIPCCLCERDNNTGIRFVEKCGMKPISDLYWIKYLPPVIETVNKRTALLFF